MRLLVGDIGGTNSRLRYLQDDCNPVTKLEKVYASAEYTGLTEIIEDFISHYNIQTPLDAACLAVAGPVTSGCATITNLPWKICEVELVKLLQTEHVSLINDLVAAAYAIPGLHEDELLVLQQGDAPISSLNVAVLAAGTGLGAAHLVWLDDHYHAFSSEAGHADFAPVTYLQEQLLAWLHSEHAHVSVEMLLSGHGIYTIYQFFRDVIGYTEKNTVREAIQAGDPATVISEHAVAGDDTLCAQTLACFIEIYGAVAGNIALHYFPVNGVYLAGGIGPKIKDMLLSNDFIDAFSNKGPMQNNLQKVPIRLVLSGEAGLDGAIAYVRQCYARLSLPCASR